MQVSGVGSRSRAAQVVTLLLTLVASGLVAVVATVTSASPASAAPCDPPVTNPVACENTLPGSPESEWGITGAGSSTIQGFATQMSVDQGQAVGFKIDTPATSYRLDIYRMGYYAGLGARKVATVNPTVLASQPNCITNVSTGLVDCGNWTQNASWTVPATAVSGIYFAKLVRTDGTAGSSHVFFVVRDDDGGSDMLFQTSDTTWQAYNTYGGNSLYLGAPASRAYKVSYNRPFTTRGNAPEDWVYNAEYPAVRFLESNGYDVSYTSGIDTDRRGAELLEHKVFLSVGHDEYWSGAQRTNVEAARDAGVNLAFLSGNEIFWKTRWENSIDGSNTPYRTLVSYKETHANAKIDPQQNVWTGTWRDPRFSPPADGGRPENRLTGTMFKVNCCAINMTVGQADGQMRFWRNTRVASLAAGASTQIGTNVIGYEWDEDPDNASRPPGLFRVSQTTGTGEVLQDQGSTYAQGQATHAMTTYRAPSGALVFGAGTIQWAWALDSNHDRGNAPADTAAQQAMINLFADMGVQPLTLMPGLTAATKSTDTTAPTATIAAPAGGSTVPVGDAVTVSGTATDTGGGRVAGVEVSTDNGTTWRRANGRASWTYTWVPTSAGAASVRVRAVDDSANLGAASAATSVTVGTGGSSACPCSIWPASATPDRTDADRDAVELGVKFRASSDGFVSGIRFYKPAESTGTHVGSLWSSTGTRLANVTFTNETASGWQTATFANPVPVTAGTTYVASYFTPSRYVVSSNYFSTSATTRGPLTALADGTDGGNGLYRYTSSAGAFPNSSYQGENYWVDVVYTDTDTTKPTVTSRTPATGATSVAVGTVVTAAFSEPVQPTTVSVQLTGPGGANVAGATTYDSASRTATLNPTAALAPNTTYTVRVSGAKDQAGNTMDALTWSFTTATADTTKPTVTGRTPAAGASGVPVSTTPTATFSEAVQQTSISFVLRNAGGTVVPSTTSYDAATRTSTLTPNAALAGSTTFTATLGGAADPSGNVMDQVTWSFTTEVPDTTKPTVTGRTPGAGATGVAVSTSPTATFSEAVQQSTVAFELRGPAGGLIASTTSYEATSRTMTLNPTATLSPGTTYTVNLSGAKDASGNTMDPVTWTFTTLASSYGCPCTIWNGTETPQRTDPDADPVELGVKFRASTNGFITGIRYYKPAESTGTHVGSLWSSTGTRLANVTFTNETASGWQTATFANPVPVTAGTTYVASYFTPSRYVVTSNYFSTSATTRGPLTALADGTDGGNGVYRYATSAGTFPDQTYTGQNYWVDVVFSDNDTTKPTVTGRTPATGATGVAVGSTVTATFDEAVEAGSVNLELRTTGGALVASTTSYAAGSRTATLTPTAPLAASTTFTVNLSGARDPAGNVMNAVSWTFTTETPDTTKPTVTSTSPASGATGTPVGSTVTGVFSEAIQESTITFELRNAANVVVPASLAYNATSRTATLTPNAALATATTYTARISGVRDVSGNTMDPLTWTFTTAANASSCPCTIFTTTDTPGPVNPDTASVELGVKFRASTNGFITGIRYYKPSQSTGTHVGSLWTAGGTRLGQVNFTNETASGWQTATFTSPIAVTAGTTYVASYFTPSRYVVSNAYFASGAKTRGPLTALAHSEGGNGVYRYAGTPSTFPNSSYQGANYWVDVVFSEGSTDTVAPTVTTRVPSPGATGVATTARPVATFSEAVTESSLSMVLRNAASQVVASTVTYDAAARTATLVPTSPLAASTGFTVSLSGARDASGNTMAPVTWSFETAAPPTPIDSGPGGPIAVVTSDAARSSTYLLEIARGEGLNEFAKLPVGNLSAATLAPYSAVVLGKVPVTAAQVTALTDWVNAGGNLVLMRPGSQLLPLAGLTAQSGTVSEGYIKVATSTEPGAGITSETMQFHGTADRYSLTGGATSVAELFTDPSVGTGQPAVAWRSVGSNGGQVATFAYDLAESIIQTRQGNPAWVGQNRDGGDAIVRSNDQFFGGSANNWVNLDKVAIPQADEQQRLLANLVTVMTRDKLPLPRFWYFPGTTKAVIVATGDDHAGGGTAGRMGTYDAASTAGCSVSRWECARFTSYVYPNSPITDDQASTYTGKGFELGLHPDNGCTNYTSLANLQGTYTAQLSAWAGRYPSLPAPVSNRFHCLVWSDWASQPKAELANGIRLDTNYYYYPGSWMGSRPGFMTGSGMPQRFADSDGSMIDVYQAATQMTDESGQSYPYTPNTLLDRALGTDGYYGAFTANLHTDNATTFEDTQVLASAQARGVPVVSAKQLLTWVDGRNASSYSGLSWSGSTLSFTVNIGAGADRLTAMLPTTGPGGRTLSAVTRGGTSVPYTLMTVKGQQYALFAAASGAYTATYGAGGAPAISEARASDLSADSATVSWTTDEPSSSALLLGSTGSSMRTVERVGGSTGDHEITVDSLAPGRRYTYRVRSTSADGTVETWPALDRPPASFTTPRRDSSAPRISQVRAQSLPDGTARVTWRTSEPATSTVRFGKGARLGRVGLDATLTRSHSVVITNLAPRRTYRFRVASSDGSGNQARSVVRRVRTTGPGVAVQTLEGFRSGTWTAGLVLDGTGYGSLTMAGRGTASYTSDVIDTAQQVDWLRAVIRGSVPRGTSASVQVRTGSGARPGAGWSDWTSPRSNGDWLKRSGRYLQFRVVLTATATAAPRITAVGFTNTGDLRSEGEVN
jgi:methionine-rich copper-binding protein CopC